MVLDVVTKLQGQCLIHMHSVVPINLNRTVKNSLLFPKRPVKPVWHLVLVRLLYSFCKILYDQLIDGKVQVAEVFSVVRTTVFHFSLFPKQQLSFSKNFFQ